MKRAIRRFGGFSLIEIMIVMVIAAAAVTLGVTWLNTERARSLRGAAADDTAREVATMARALDTYIATATTLPASGAFDVPHADLVAAGLLPPDYAMRDVGGGGKALVSPLGQAYRLRAIKQGTKYRGAVLVSAGIAATAFRKIGVDPTEQGAFDFATVMMRRAREKFLITSAVVRTGQATTDLPLSGFSADLTELLGGPAAQPVLAALAGFSELNTNPDIKVSVDPDSLAGAVGGLDVEGRECRMTDSVCSADEEAVWERGFCEGAPDLDQPGIVVGAISRTVKIGSKDYNVGITVNTQALGELAGIGAGYYTSIFYSSNGTTWVPPSNWSSWVPEITATVNALGFRSDNLVIVPGAAGRTYSSGVDADTANGIAVLPGTTYSTVGMLPSCGGAMELPTYVYRVETGAVSWQAGSGLTPSVAYMAANSSWPYSAGTQFMSAVNPANLGKPASAISTKVTFGPFPPVMCDFRALASEYNGQNGIYTNAANFASRFGENGAFYQSRFTSFCPMITTGLRNYADGTALGKKSAYPVRAYGYKYTGNQSYKYCCKK